MRKTSGTYVLRFRGKKGVTTSTTKTEDRTAHNLGPPLTQNCPKPSFFPLCSPYQDLPSSSSLPQTRMASVVEDGALPESSSGDQDERKAKSGRHSRFSVQEDLIICVCNTHINTLAASSVYDFTLRVRRNFGSNVSKNNFGKVSHKYFSWEPAYSLVSIVKM